MEYKQKLKDLDYSNVNNFLSEKALNFGNRTVVTSAAIILISLNFLSIEILEFEGISGKVNTTIIILVSLIVNFYYYQQFIIALRIDENKYKAPDEYTQFGEDIKTISEPFKSILPEYVKKAKEIQEKVSDPNITAEEAMELNIEAKINYEELIKIQQSIEKTEKALIADNIKAREFDNLTNKYNNLNANMPRWIYFLGLISVIIRFIIFTYQVYDTQDHPFDYMIKNEMNYYKVIFENKDIDRLNNKTSP
ncbi:hypothetical protein SAMN05421664_2560 [Chryseobacterium soldanellicola]|uniref:Uncharacterized protein n=1 Tax=Chryseobacterium soldanellicola TaxID=311333 RepID=A0A1H1DN98_9FLAO|nr:hypothetical protein [Chryseobacterium soldanellicola]SDQ77883.1 hypothetical protein SAMN05421664_2560 [Chryseobacterium soldanellicola]